MYVLNGTYSDYDSQYGSVSVYRSGMLLFIFSIIRFFFLILFLFLFLLVSFLLGTQSNWITISAYPGHQPVIYTPVNAFNLYVISISRCSYVLSSYLFRSSYLSFFLFFFLFFLVKLQLLLHCDQWIQISWQFSSQH